MDELLAVASIGLDLAAELGVDTEDGGGGYGAAPKGKGGGKRSQPYQGGAGAGGFASNPGAPVCQFFMKTGNCKFGQTCKFDHPAEAAGAGGGGGGGGGGGELNSQGLPLNIGAADCAFYMKTGSCKFGPTCRFNHPEGVDVMLGAEGGKGAAKGGGGGDGELNSAGYPMNPGMEDCTFFMKTGQCKFGMTCRYNHPEGIATVEAGDGSEAMGGVGGKGKGKGKGKPGGGGGMMNSAGFPLNPGQEDCSFFMKTGSCKFGPTCRFNHPDGVAAAAADNGFAIYVGGGGGGGTGSKGGQSKGGYCGGGGGGGGGSNSLGYPLNPGQPDCAFYMKSGSCKFGATCRFNHPELGAAQGGGNSGVGEDWGDDAWSALSGLLEDAYGGGGGKGKGKGGGGKGGYGGAAAAATGASGEHPRRPGEPACSFFTKTGNCKFGMTCKFDHPPGGVGAGGGGGGGAAADWGGGGGGEHPVRPGEPPCAFFLKTGSCKFGTTCKFDHPPEQAGMGGGGGMGGGMGDGAQLNSSGYPIRPGVQQCQFYMKTSRCKFGATCKNDHPEGVGGSGKDFGGGDDGVDAAMFATLLGDDAAEETWA